MDLDLTTLDPGLVLAALFAGALIASTLLPLQSEALLVGALFVEGIDPALAVLVASLGNTMGGQINWWLGLHLRRLQTRRWFPATPAQLARAEGWFEKWGVWALTLCWTPWLGDPLTVVAGALRTPFWLFTAITGAARALRYALVAWATLAF